MAILGTFFMIIWEILQGRISLIPVILLLKNFVSGFRCKLMYISLIVNIRLSPVYPHGFGLLVLLPLSIEIIIFCLYQKNKISESKVKFRQATNCCHRVLEVAKLIYANKTIRVHHFTETWLLRLLANC